MSFVFNSKTMFTRVVYRNGDWWTPAGFRFESELVKRVIIDYSNNEESEKVRHISKDPGTLACKLFAVTVDQCLIALVETDWVVPTTRVWGRFEVNGYHIMADWKVITFAQFTTYRDLKLAPVVKGIIEDESEQAIGTVIFGELDMPFGSPEFKEVVKAISPNSQKVHATLMLESQALAPIEQPEQPEPVELVESVEPSRPQ